MTNETPASLTKKLADAAANLRLISDEVQCADVDDQDTVNTMIDLLRTAAHAADEATLTWYDLTDRQTSAEQRSPGTTG